MAECAVDELILPRQLRRQADLLGGGDLQQLIVGLAVVLDHARTKPPNGVGVSLLLPDRAHGHLCGAGSSSFFEPKTVGIDRRGRRRRSLRSSSRCLCAGGCQQAKQGREHRKVTLEFNGDLHSKHETGKRRAWTRSRTGAMKQIRP
jgi:hypothetical protein